MDPRRAKQHTLRLRALAIGVGAMVLLLAGCGGSSSDSSSSKDQGGASTTAAGGSGSSSGSGTPSGGAGGKGAAACNLVSDADASAMVGVPVKLDPKRTHAIDESGVKLTNCFYGTSDPGHLAFFSVSRNGVDITSMEAGAKGDASLEYKPLTGVGDHGYTVNNAATGSSVVVFVKDDAVYSFNATNPDAAPAARQAAVLKVAKQVAGNV